MKLATCLLKINPSRWLKLIRAFDEIRRGEAVDQNFPFTDHSVSKKAGETVRRGETKGRRREKERRRDFDVFIIFLSIYLS